MDSFFHSFLYLPVSFLYELFIVLRTDRACIGRRNIRKQRNIIPSCYTDIAENIKKWLDEDGFIRQGLTIKELAETLHTNRTYLSNYIKTAYHQSFRDWITAYRIEYAKRLMIQYPEQTIAEISEKSGFLSLSHFIRIFREKEGISPAKWRKSRF